MSDRSFAELKEAAETYRAEYATRMKELRATKVLSPWLDTLYGRVRCLPDGSIILLISFREIRKDWVARDSQMHLTFHTTREEAQEVCDRVARAEGYILSPGGVA